VAFTCLGTNENARGLKRGVSVDERALPQAERRQAWRLRTTRPGIQRLTLARAVQYARQLPISRAERPVPLWQAPPVAHKSGSLPPVHLRAECHQFCGVSPRRDQAWTLACAGRLSEAAFTESTTIDIFHYKGRE
jgi:hypothetical protein